MPKDDRDHYQPKTSPEKVRSQSAAPADEIHDELTPVDGSLEIQTNKRATQAAGQTKAALMLVREVQLEQKDLREAVRDYAEADKADHKEMKTDISEIKANLTTLNGHMGDVREELGNVSGKLEVLTSTLQVQQQSNANEKHLRLTYTLSTRKEIWKSVLKGAAAIVTAGGTVIAAYYATKFFH